MLDALPVLAELPGSPAWEYGGYPYGLELLVLPPPGVPFPGGAMEDPAGAYGDACRVLLAFSSGGCAGQEAPPCLSAADLFWFRWITGHQATFVLWSLVAEAIREVPEDEVPPVEVLARLAHYVRGCAALLLYMGSCSPAVYEEVVRPSMHRQHPSFSGGWAPDFLPVRSLFRVHAPRFTHADGAAELVEVLRVHQSVHDGVAAKLVPDGKSLLQQSWAIRPQDPRLPGLLYDNYFLTLRAPVDRSAVLGQLLRRLAAVAHDVAVNTLNPSLWQGERPVPAALVTPDALALERDFPDIVFRAGAVAARLPDGDAALPLAGSAAPAAD